MVRKGIGAGMPSGPLRRALRSLCALVAVAAALLCTLVRADDPIVVSVVDVDGPAEGVVRVVFAVDRADRPIGDLALENVSVTVDGQPVNLLSLSLKTDATVPIDVVLAIDVSGSMAGETMSAAQAAATSLVRDLGPSDRGAVVTFGGAVQVVQGPTDSKEALAAAIAALAAGGDTALFDGVTESARVATASAGQRRAVIVLSDGEDYGGRSVASREEAIAAAVASDTVFYTVGVGGFFDRSFLQELASATGGRFLEAGGAADLPPLYEVLSSLLKGRHVLTFERPVSAAEQAVRITVSALESSGSIEFSLPAPAAPSPTAASPTPTTVSPTPTAVTPQADSGGGSTLATVVAAATAGGLALVAGAVVLRRRRTGPVPWNPSKPLEVEGADPGREASEPEAWTATFEVLGPDLPLREVKVGPGPATIGSREGCDVLLPTGEGVGEVHARIWRRDGRTMLHHVAGAGDTLVNGQPVDWIGISPGDRLTIGPYVVTYLK